MILNLLNISLLYIIINHHQTNSHRNPILVSTHLTIVIVSCVVTQPSLFRFFNEEYLNGNVIQTMKYQK